MTPEIFLKMNTNKDGSINQTAQKNLAKIEAEFGKALAKTKDELVKNPPHDISAFQGRYIDYRNAQDAITKAEKVATDDNLTHFQHPTLISVPIPTAQGIRKIQRLGEETILQYKWLTIYTGAVPVHSSNINNGRNQGSAGQNFGKGLTTAERQSLSMVFGIRHRSNNDPTINNSNGNYHRNYSRNNYNNYNRYNNNYNSNYNNGGSRNFTHVGNRYHNNNNYNNNTSYYPQSNSSNNLNTTNTSNTSENTNNSDTNSSTDTSNTTKSNNASAKDSSSNVKPVKRITTTQAQELKKRIDAVIKSGGMNKTLALNTVKRMTDVKQNKQLNYLPVTKYNKAMKMLESFIKPKK